MEPEFPKPAALRISASKSTAGAARPKINPESRPSRVNNAKTQKAREKIERAEISLHSPANPKTAKGGLNNPENTL